MIHLSATAAIPWRDLAQGDYSPLIFWTGDKRLQDAFCEGASLDSFPA